ncbi:MAG: hypothetical protein ABFR33_11210, partial [Verrucomicrobiota bacterium]
VVKKKEIECEPPKAVERPKMKLKKPKVKIRKTSRPKPTNRIVAKVNRASMPDIQLPEMSGMGDGLGDIVGGFDMMPDFEDVTIFGGAQSIGNDFEGTFYDFKHDRRGNSVAVTIYEYEDIYRRFVKHDFDTKAFSRFARSPKKLYATHFMIPPLPSGFGPKAFGQETDGYYWGAHYKGKLVHKEGITFRFWGHGDNFMLVRLDGELVLNACWPGPDKKIVPQYYYTAPNSRRYHLGNNTSVGSDWITLEPGVPRDMEVMIGEMWGGNHAAMLLVEVQGVEYEENSFGAPIFPIFKTAELSLDQMEKIYEFLVENECCLTNGPVFNDFGSRRITVAADTNEVIYPSFESQLFNPDDTAEMRTWTGLDGKTLEAGFTAVIGDKAVLKDARGRQRKIPVERLSAEDREFVELARPPKFNIDFAKQSEQQPVTVNPWMTQLVFPTFFDYIFTAKLKQVSAGTYNHELQVEFFVFGEEVDGNNYILFDRQEGSFTPAKENERSFRLSGNKVEVSAYDNYYGQMRGTKYGGYLVVVTDSHGKIIDHGTSHKWLPDILGQLRALPLGKHFDKTGTRVMPPRPRRNY